jgi:hypothetical protein
MYRSAAIVEHMLGSAEAAEHMYRSEAIVEHIYWTEETVESRYRLATSEV